MLSEKDNQIMFLLSMPRSGSTLLSLMMGSHHEISCPPEPWIVLALAEYFDLGNVRNVPYGREVADIAAMEFLLNIERQQRGSLSNILRSLYQQKGPLSNVFRSLFNEPALNQIALARRVLQAIYQLKLKITKKNIFIDKTPRNYAVLGLIEQIFPHGKKIILLRNPLDIFASYKSTWEVKHNIFTPENVSVHTRDFCEGLFKLADYVSAPRKDVLVIRYESLVIDAEDSLRSACKFANIDFSSAMLDFYNNSTLIEEYRQSTVGDPVSSDKPAPANNRTVNAWEERLHRSDIEVLISVLGVDVFERLGYGDTVIKLRDMSLTIPTEEEASDRRKFLMKTLIEKITEQPFSAWKNFVSPMNECLRDRAERLNVIHQLQTEVITIHQQLEISEADLVSQKLSTNNNE